MGPNIIFLGLAIVIIGGGDVLPGAKRAQTRSDAAILADGQGNGHILQDGSAAGACRGGSKGSDQFDVSVQYQFRAGGQLHFGSTVSYPALLCMENRKRKTLPPNIPAGATVTVYYNPEDFRECYLEIRTTAKYYRTSIVLMAAGGLIGLFGILQTFA